MLIQDEWCESESARKYETVDFGHVNKMMVACSCSYEYDMLSMPEELLHATHPGGWIQIFTIFKGNLVVPLIFTVFHRIIFHLFHPIPYLKMCLDLYR